MWIADKWKDYEVISTSGGEKLERWGDYILVRPDPQVIWNTPKYNPGWTHFNGHYHRSSKGGGEWEFKNLPEEWSIHYDELTFNLKPFAFKHTGLFPEQAVNWDWFSDIIKKQLSDNPGRTFKVLNLFAYTGGATLSAAKAGFLPAWVMRRSDGSWMTASNSSKEKSVAETNMTVSSWIRPRTAEALKARSGKSKKAFSLLSN